MEGSFGLMNKRLDEQGKCDFEKRPFIQPMILILLYFYN